MKRGARNGSSPPWFASNHHRRLIVLCMRPDMQIIELAAREHLLPLVSLELGTAWRSGLHQLLEKRLAAVRAAHAGPGMIGIRGAHERMAAILRPGGRPACAVENVTIHLTPPNW